MFAILLENIAIGTISLSHQDIAEKKARIGCWISSRYWNNGYTSQAFCQLLDYAKGKGIKQCSAKIKEDNLASKRIWEKYGGKVEIINHRFWVSLEL
jgi:ribosomal-protein-alanine N-acetyltransferase